uniref:cysteine-rich DPF motif domain-containing protein 1 n=1 Tax=Myxine glutinosa TaxID=7769 RepID=UPI00358DEE7F
MEKRPERKGTSQLQGGTFECALCTLDAPYDYFGKKPPYARSIRLQEESFVIKDPFSTERGRVLILGSRCKLCQRTVCAGQDCSLFYTRRFCLPCSRERIAEFPKEIQQEIKRKDCSKAEDAK